MTDAVNYIVMAIPVFFLLIGIEVAYDKVKKTGYYRFNDAVSNINAGIAEQVTGIFLKAFVVGIYALVYERYKLFTVPQNILTYVLLFTGVDFFYYWFHRSAHEINFLWGGHVVHHQSEEMNLSVALRQGVFQKTGSFIFYLPLAFFGFNPIMFVVVSQFQTLYQFWIHTKTIDKLPRPFEFILNTPSHHRVHHGRNPEYIDKNHGGTLIIWDRMFGTFQPEKEIVVYGITKPLNTWNPIRAQIDFWRDLFRNELHIAALKDKWKMIWMPPGWYPKELGGPQTPEAVTTETAIKYETAIPPRLNYYVFIQFVLAIGLTSVFLFKYGNLSNEIRIVFALLLLFSITVIGEIFETRKWVFTCELIRLVVTPLFFMYLLKKNDLPHVFLPGLFILLISSLVSLIWICFYKDHFKN